MVNSVEIRRIFLSLGGMLLFLLCLSMPLKAALNGTVSGKVLDGDGKAIANVRVVLQSPEGKNPERVTKSNRKGSYRIPNVNPGEYNVIAEAEGYTYGNVITIRVATNNKVDLDLFMDVIQPPKMEGNSDPEADVDNQADLESEEVESGVMDSGEEADPKCN